jgi:hypothetical protein
MTLREVYLGGLKRIDMSNLSAFPYAALSGSVWKPKSCLDQAALIFN